MVHNCTAMEGTTSTDVFNKILATLEEVRQILVTGAEVRDEHYRRYWERVKKYETVTDETPAITDQVEVRDCDHTLGETPLEEIVKRRRGETDIDYAARVYGESQARYYNLVKKEIVESGTK